MGATWCTVHPVYAPGREHPNQVLARPWIQRSRRVVQSRGSAGCPPEPLSGPRVFHHTTPSTAPGTSIHRNHGYISWPVVTHTTPQTTTFTATKDSQMVLSTRTAV